MPKMSKYSRFYPYGPKSAPKGSRSIAGGLVLRDLSNQNIVKMELDANNKPVDSMEIDQQAENVAMDLDNPLAVGISALKLK